MNGWIEYLILIFLILLNAFFAASELAIVSSRKTRIKQMAEEGSRRARAVMRLSENPSRFLATIQVGVTLAGFFASAFGAVSLSHALESAFQQVSFLAPAASTLSFILVTVLIAFVTLLFGELVPKTLAVGASERIALAVAGPIEIIAKVAAPLIAFLTATTNLIVRLLGGRHKAVSSTVSQEEIVSMVTTGQEEGIFQPQQEEFIRRVFDFSEKRVREVMVPRLDMVMLNAEMTLQEAAPEILQSDYSRYPIYTETRENITGEIFSKDILRAYMSGQTQLKLGDIARKPLFVPESKHVPELFTELQKSRNHMALVIDEYGSVAGLVTLEDLLEEIVGEIQDEFDHEENMFAPVGENEFSLSGRLSLFDLTQELKMDLGLEEAGESLEVDTIAGLVMAELKHIPTPGETVRLPINREVREDVEEEYRQTLVNLPTAVNLTVMEMDGLRIKRVLLKIEYPEPASQEQTPPVVSDQPV
jgi:putative hemolysin